MSLTPTYARHYPWVRTSMPTGNRPYSEVYIKGPTSRIRIFCLVDSGADRLLVDESFATQVGLAVNGTPITSRTASGSSLALTEVSGVEVTVEGKTKYNEKVRFGKGVPALLGRVTFLDFFTDVGFDGVGWQHT